MKQEQLTLNGAKLVIKEVHTLSENYLKILEVFINNPNSKLNQSILSTYFIKNRIMSRVTILRFLSDATKWGYIAEMKPTVVTLSKQGYKSIQKAIFNDGSEIKDLDARKKYYKITKEGVEVWKKNTMCI